MNTAAARGDLTAACATIRDAQPAIDAAQRLPEPVVAAVTSADLWRMLVPTSLGGAEASIAEHLSAVEAVAHADGSAGWCLNQTGAIANIAPVLDPTVAATVWAGPDAVVATGVPLTAPATAERTGASYLLEGRWSFASGCHHATWFVPSAIVDDGTTRSFLVPASAVRIEDDWDVRGLRGTGSCSYTISAAVVPAPFSYPVPHQYDRRDGAVPVPTQTVWGSGFGAVALGIARRALDEFADLAMNKTPFLAARSMRDDPLVQTGLAEAEAMHRATRAYLHAAAAAIEGSSITEEHRRDLRLAATHAMRTSADVVDRVYALAGTNGIFVGSPLHRCFQDIHALAQQTQARRSYFTRVGRSFLGFDDDIVW